MPSGSRGLSLLICVMGGLSLPMTLVYEMPPPLQGFVSGPGGVEWITRLALATHG